MGDQSVLGASPWVETGRGVVISQPIVRLMNSSGCELYHCQLVNQA